MSNEQQPARVSAAIAKAMLGIKNKLVWRKVVDANPQLVHRIPGEIRAKYLTSEINKLLKAK